jgi:hypothetical protein
MPAGLRALIGHDWILEAGTTTAEGQLRRVNCLTRMNTENSRIYTDTAKPQMANPASSNEFSFCSFFGSAARRCPPEAVSV